MIAFLLLALVGPHPGGAPTAWQPLAGESEVKYRWSRPTSNSCLVEFANGEGAPLSFDLTAKVMINRPDPPLTTQENISALRPEPPKFVPKEREQTFSIALGRMSSGVQSIHDCYGIDGIKPQLDGASSLSGRK